MKKISSDKPNFEKVFTENKIIIYSFIFYSAGLLLGSLLYTKFSDSTVRSISDVINPLSSDFLSVFFNMFILYAVVFAAVVLTGITLFGFGFINIIPFVIGIMIAIKLSYYYTTYGTEGITYCTLMIIPQWAAFTEIIMFTIESSSALSKIIYKNTLKSGEDERVNIKKCIVNLLIYVIILVAICAVNALITSSLVTIIKI